MARKAALLSFLSLFVLTLQLASAGTPHLVLDINSVAWPISSTPVIVGTLGNTGLFRADLSTGGVTHGALVKSDGTSAGSAILKTFDGNGPTRRAMTIGTRAFFDGHEDTTGDQLWVTDGTAAGTRQVTSFTPASTVLLQLVAAFGNDLLFARYVGGGSQYQLYRTDGTVAGTTAIAPITGYGNTSATFDLAVVGNKIYFITTSSTYQTELWVSDGTAAGTHKIPAVTALDSSVGLSGVRALNGGAVFVTSTNTYGRELTRVDASEAVSVIDLAPGAGNGAMGDPIVIDGYAYFAGSTSGTDYELWRSDGTLSGTTLVKDINPTSTSSLDPYYGVFLQVGKRLIFSAYDGTSSGLWGSDGTAAGTVPLAAVSFSLSGPQSLLETGSVKYRYLRANANGNVPITLITDGTPAGTATIPSDGSQTMMIQAAGDATTEYVDVVKNSATTGITTSTIYKFTQPNQFTSVYSSSGNQWLGGGAFVYVNGKLLFDGFDPAAGQELLVTDDNGTRLASDFAPQATTGHSSPAWFTDWNGKAVFEADDGVHGRALWISDGTAAGTRVLADLNPAADGPGPRTVAVWNGALYFFAYDGTSYRLMRMTAPDATPQVLATADPPLRINDTPIFSVEANRCQLPNAVALGNRLLFTASTLQTGTELWSTDGTAAGTAMVVDLNTVSLSGGAQMGAQPCGLTQFQNRVYFSATTILSGASTPWSTDGTAAGTTQIPNFAGGGAFRVYNNELYFRGTDTVGTLGSQTWKTDGTVAGTRPLVTATSVGNKFDGVPLGVSNGKLILYILSITGSGPSAITTALWASDGTGSAPVLLGAPNLTGSGITLTPERVYFSSPTASDDEPWVSDGTVAGTRRLADLDTAGSSHPYAYIYFRGVVLIMTADSTGPHLWRTDGTESGTTQIGTIPPRPGLFTTLVAGQNLFFSGVDDLLGDELYVFSNDAPVAVADSASATDGAAVTVNVLANDADPDGSLDASTTLVVQAPAHGTTSVGTNGAITYTPTAGYSGSDTFTYTVADKQANRSNAATVTLTVTAAPPSSGGGNNGGGGKGGGGPLRWYDLLALGALLSLRFVRNSRPAPWSGKNLSPAVNNL